MFSLSMQILLLLAELGRAVVLLLRAVVPQDLAVVPQGPMVVPLLVSGSVAAVQILPSSRWWAAPITVVPRTGRGSTVVSDLVPQVRGSKGQM